ncbi:energy-coupling factor ABC transporter substrate-binding protein [Nocardiopsis aegyptia]|uniref:Cobalt transport protein CbiN n=1 Tax=Nocardiopsis aegyptia TaxID=220378 RepID=A0A7Z0EIB3_9ACTN|nr:energy-coupling factor ABC transporter substrate-binding protein [Nocardiopsis aegyptia]NYJ32588.1 cobalt/nickel transport protein [Nocardiopsis aegyptia]
MSDPTKPRAWVTWALLGAVAVLAVLPLMTGAADHLEEPFAGADGEAEGLVTELHPDYEPWLSPVVELPSGEVESGLFALQAAIGAGVVGYVLGVMRTRSRYRNEAASGVTVAATASAAAPATAAEPGARSESGSNTRPATEPEPGPRHGPGTGLRPAPDAEPRPEPAEPPPHGDTAER